MAAGTNLEKGRKSMRVRTIAPALLLCLALTACGVEEQEKN